MLLPEAAMAKRQCLPKRDYTYPPSHPSQTIPQQHIALEKQIAMEKQIEMNKLAQQQHHQKHQLHMRSKVPPGPQKYSPAPAIQLSPGAMVQQHSEHDRHPVTQHGRPVHFGGTSQTLRPHPSPSQFSPHHGGPQQAAGQRRQSSPYEIPASVQVQVPSTAKQTESVALKGFFEPTHKVTVNAAANPTLGTSSRPTQQHVSMPQMIPSERALSQAAARGMPGYSNEHAVHEDPRQPSAGYPHTSVYQRSPGGRLGPVPLPRSPSGPVSDLELMQQRQMQFQLQQQQQQSQAQKHFHREQKITPPQKSPLSPQDQKVAMMMELQKQETRKVQYPDKEPISPYSSAIVRQTAYPEGSIRHEKPDMGLRCMKVQQPVPLPEIHQTHAQTFERIQSNSSHSDTYRSRQQGDSRSFMETAVPAPTAGTSIRNLPSSIRYEPNTRYRISEQYEKHQLPGIPLSEPVPMHPSVIQRPQGYIPPRIVRRESSDSSSARRPSDRDRMYPTQTGVMADYVSEQMSVRHELSVRGNRPQYGPSKDILSGRDVLRIQQRAAEQRSNEMQISSRHHSKNSETPGSAVETPGYSERRRSLTDINNSRPHSSEAMRSTPSVERGRLLSPQGREMPGSSGSSSSKSMAGHPAPSRSSSGYNVISGRSITKGTSGVNKSHQGDFLSQFLMRELKKPNDEETINPFANRSLLEEFDRTANASASRAPDKQARAENETSTNKQSVVEKTVSQVPETKESDDSNASKSDSSYTLPLQIAIPGHKTNTQLPGSSEPSRVSEQSRATTSVKQETSTPAPPKPQKFMSRKQMILNAFRQEEDLNKNTVNIDKDEKVPMESAKYVSMKLEKDSSQYCPPSPKMPILSPQERSRNTPLVSPAQIEQPPPSLENSSSTSGQASGEKGKDNIRSLEEHLHRMISNALNKDSKEANEKDVVETVCRELQNQGHKLFVSRQTSVTRNIPVANVAPIVHGKLMPESLDTQHDDKTKQENENQKTETVDSEIDDEDAKIAEVVTRSIFGDNLGRFDTRVKTEPSEQDRDGSNDNEQNSAMDEKVPVGNDESPFDENSSSMRMSPGLKKLMLYRHRDMCETSTNASSVNSEDNASEITENIAKSTSDSGNHKKHSETNRNVFGALSELAQQCSQRKSVGNVDFTGHLLEQQDEESTRGSGYQDEEDAGEGTAVVVSRII